MSGDHSQIVSFLRDGFNSDVLRDIEYRKEIISKFIDLLSENQKALTDALYKDLHRCESESLGYEIWPTKAEAKMMIKYMETWLRDEYISRSMMSFLDTGYIQRQPYGVSLIMAPWNFPIHLAIVPTIGAVAAGNCVLLKLSEYTPNVATVLAELIPKYIDKRVCQVLCGDADVSKDLLESQHFDHIFYTGGTSAGREVYVAAAKKLTPVVLELGGKCPAYIDSNADLDLAAHRIVWCKLINCGQICITTDYVLCHESVLSKFQEAVKSALKEFMGNDPHSCDDFGRIVNARHFNRIAELIKNTKGKIIVGGDSIADELYVAPTVVTNVSEDDALMQDEIFAPILPIVPVDSYNEALRIIKSKPKPLAIYVFTEDSKVFQSFLSQTSSGALLQNGCFYHAAISELPFGGVGESGIGAYHGRHTIEAFSHRRAVLIRPKSEYINRNVMYRPYTPSKMKWMRWIFGEGESSCITL